ncbi:MAG: phage terminase large subunit [Myxococcota bacterium]
MSLRLIHRVRALQKERDRMRAARVQRRATTEAGTLLDFVPRISPRYEPPAHLPQLVDFLDRIRQRQEVRGLFSVPPRHAKTETVLHAIAWLLAGNPHLTIGYASYSETFARQKSRIARDYTRAAGVELRTDSTALDQWQTIEGGGLIARGMEGAWTGLGVDVLIIDDPHKNRSEADSPVKRRRVLDWWHSAGVSRVEPGGSVLVVHTRWHPDDLIGHLSNDAEVEWEYHNLPVINDGSDPAREEGAPLWPSRWPLDKLQARRREVTEFEWASLYQGQPRPRGDSVFGEPQFYDELPSGGWYAHGADLAYTAKTYADFSVVVTMLRLGSSYYVVDVVRRQVDAPTFCGVLAKQAGRYPGRMLWHASGTEKGAAQFIRSRVPRFEVHPATADKFVRAQPVAAAWNDGRVFIPRNANWGPAFLAEVRAFTGVGDDHDDQVDALASAFSALQVTRARSTRNLPAW